MKKNILFLLMFLFFCSVAFAVAPGVDTVDSLCGQAKGYLQNYIDTGKIDERWAYLALDMALKARKLDSSSADPHLVMAQVFIEMGELDKAAERVKVAGRLNPENPKVAEMVKALRVYSAQKAGGLLAGIDGIEVIENPDGVSYLGGIRDGKREGYGLYSHPNGTTYVGTWKNDKMHGHGSYVWPDGQKYIGEWIEGERTGHGHYWWPNNTEYIGQFQDNRKQGHGIMEYPDGSVYIGEMDKGEKHGHGKLLFPSRELYVGEFRNGQRYGHGVYSWPNNSRYVGMWDNTRAMGGYHFWPDGSRTWSYQDNNNNWVNKKQ